MASVTSSTTSLSTMRRRNLLRLRVVRPDIRVSVASSDRVRCPAGTPQDPSVQ